jgi:peptide/nickel transport system ATP-binding protein
VLELLRDLQQRLGMSMVIVTHDLSVAASVADQVAVMYAGRIVEQGPIREIVHHPQHPYTRGLLAANVRPGQHQRPEAIPGSPPNLARLPAGCAFAPRCPLVTDVCREAPPAFVQLSADHAARCALLSRDAA